MLRVFPNKDDARIVRRGRKRVGPRLEEAFETTLGNIPWTAAAVPEGFPELSEAEKAELQRKFFVPAKARLEKQRHEEEEQKLDPMRRMPATCAAIDEMATLSQRRPVDEAELEGLLRRLLAVRSANPLFPLHALKLALHSATLAAEADEFGARSDNEALTDSPVSTLWSEIRDAHTALMQALQRKKYVRVRKGKAVS